MDEQAARTDAIAIAEKKPFAVVGGPGPAQFVDELAARDIICLGACATAVPEEFFKDRDPYLWTVAPSPEQASRLSAEMIDTQAGPGPAEYAGDPDLRDDERVYALVHFETEEGTFEDTIKLLKQDLKKRGIDIAVDVPFELDLARIQEEARTIVSKLEEGDVTTVVFYGDPLSPTPTASTSGSTASHPPTTLTA